MNRIYSLATIVMIAVIFVFSTEISKAENTKEAKAKKEIVKPDVMPQCDLKELAANVKYPENARKNGIEGTVYVKALISKKGTVTKCEVEKSDNELLTQAAVKAVKKTKFVPAMAGDKAVKAWVVLPVKFKLK